MREIKFRVWDKGTNTFNYWGFLIEPYECFQGIATGGDTTIDYVKNNSEQYTGLKDKNGVEIYEGDRLFLHGFVEGDYSVCFIEGAFCITNGINNDYPIDFTLCYPSIGCIIEIIGNIHEGIK